MNAPVYALSSSEVLQNPFPTYARMREEHPIYKMPDGPWFLTRAADVAQVLRDPRFGRGEYEKEFAERMGLVDEPPYILPMHWRDPPEHTRLRGLVSKAFTARMIEAMRPGVAAKTEQILDSVQAAGRVEFLSEIAYPLPIAVICDMLGIPPEDRHRARELSQAHSQALSAPATRRDLIEHGNETRRQMAAYFRDLIASRRDDRREDVLGVLIAAEEAGDRLSEGDLLATLIGLVFAGHETTANALGNGMLALLENPDQVELLRNDFSLIPRAVDEMLRYDPPVVLAYRVALRDADIGGVPCPAGQLVLPILAAANRDPAVYSDPDRFDVKRPIGKHFEFGGGVHYCLGAQLAKLQMTTLVEAMFRRMQNLALAPDQTFRFGPSLAMRGLESLHMTF